MASDGRMYYPLLNPVIRTANVIVNEFIETLVKRQITIYDDTYLFRRLIMILRTDDEFDRLMRGDIVDDVKAIRIESIEDVSDVGARDMDISAITRLTRMQTKWQVHDPV